MLGAARRGNVKSGEAKAKQRKAGGNQILSASATNLLLCPDQLIKTFMTFPFPVAVKFFKAYQHAMPYIVYMSFMLSGLVGREKRSASRLLRFCF
jgi:hypothetical protein